MLFWIEQTQGNVACKGGQRRQKVIGKSLKPGRSQLLVSFEPNNVEGDLAAHGREFNLEQLHCGLFGTQRQRFPCFDLTERCESGGARLVKPVTQIDLDWLRCQVAKLHADPLFAASEDGWRGLIGNDFYFGRRSASRAEEEKGHQCNSAGAQSTRLNGVLHAKPRAE